MEVDILQEVAQDEIPKVLEAMRQNWPKHFLVYQYVSIMEDYKNSKQKLHQVLYRCGNIEDGVYIFKTEVPIGPKTVNYYLTYTASTDLSSLARVLAETTRIPWQSRNFLFEVTLARLSPVILQTLAEKGVEGFMAHNNFLMYYPPDKELHMREVPEDLYLDLLDESHVPEVDRNWPHRYPGSDQYLELEIKYNFGLGLFRKTDKKLMSSSISFHSGGIFVLYSDPQFRGRGYAEIIIQNMVKEIRQRRSIPFATILLKNTPSHNLFKKVGFEEFAKADWIVPVS